MRTTTAVAMLFAAVAGVSASSSSHPVLAFTSQQASAKIELPTESSMTSFVDSLLASGKRSPACQLDAITLVYADKLDRETFASLKHSSSDSLRARSLDAPSQVTFNAAPDTEVADKIIGACGFGKYGITSMKSKDVASPAVKDAFNFYEIVVNDLRKEESSLLQSLDSVDEMHPRNLVVVMQNGKLHQHTKRQNVAPSSTNGKWTEPTGGIFAKYQLFSTPLILTLILVGGVLIPIVYFAVSQLAQVQTPDQMGVRKDPISGDKKTQ